MKANNKDLCIINDLLNEYIKEIDCCEKEGTLKKNTADTYRLHAKNFVKWCKDDFIPGGRNR